MSRGSNKLRTSPECFVSPKPQSASLSLGRHSLDMIGKAGIKMLPNTGSVLRSGLLQSVFFCLLILVFTTMARSAAQEEATQSVAEAARAARARHAQASSDTPSNGTTATKHAPFSQSQLLAWTIAGVSATALLTAVQANGIDFAPDDAHLTSLKDAQLSPDLLTALPTVPSHPRASTLEPVPQPLIAASQAFNLKDYSLSLKLLETLTRQSPNADLFAALGNLQVLVHNQNSAKTAFERSVQLDPTFVYAHLRLAGIYYTLEDGPQATTEARRVLRLQPGNPQARKYLALSMTVDGSSSAAGGHPEFEGDVDDLSDLKAGTNQEAKNLNDKALELAHNHALFPAEVALKRAIELEPNVALYHYNLGWVYTKWLYQDKALASYQKAKVLAPRNLAIRQNIGYTLCQAQRWNEAVAEFSEILSMDPTWNMARPCLYEALYNLGRKNEAARVLNDYSQFNLSHGLHDDSDEIDAEKKAGPKR
jgi:tetratricopeptide (TPR) repeat protein